MRPLRTCLALLGLTIAGACSSSYADTPVAYERPPHGPVERRDPPSYSPYRIEVLGSDFGALPTYYQGGRAYVLGAMGQRYRVRVSNPTSRRVEAVVSVDGLDAIDGRTASYSDKRGYIISPYSEVTLDGFRTSVNDVATFRFSSVRDSYAGRKGNDRNVGVIGVAVFPERERPIVRRYPPRPYEYDRERASADETPARKSAPAPSTGALDGEAKAGSSAGAPRSAAPAPERPGLGTEFGERRAAHVDFTRFERENPSRPASILEVRYNDRDGLVALGIPVDDYPHRIETCDLCTRESADPFPGRRFAEPPP
jgi:hypothetical protein